MTLFDTGAVGERELLPCDGSALYVPGFLPPLEAARYMAAFLEEIPWEARAITVYGRQVMQPRLACWYGDVPYTYSGLTLPPRPWTERLSQLKIVIESASGHVFNSVLVNLYRDGRDSMGWHADDEPELGSAPVIASLSLGRTRRFRLRHRDTKETVVVELESGSLLIMSGLSQQCWMHEVPKARRIDEPRINLTFRLVHPELRR